MARGRMIDKDFWTSGEFYRHPYWVQVMVGAMLCSSDDEGRIRADLEWIRSRFLSREPRQLMPSSRQVRVKLAELVKSSVIATTTKNGVSYYQFTSFKSFQKLKRAGRNARGKELTNRKKQHPLPPEGGRECVGDSPRAVGTNQRALGTNPRARGTNPRAAEPDAWRDFERLAGQQDSVENAAAYTRKLRQSHSHPDDTGISWWLERSDSPEKLRRRELIAELEKSGQGPGGAEIVSGIGYRLGRGIVPWSDVPIADLLRMVGKIRKE